MDIIYKGDVHVGPAWKTDTQLGRWVEKES
jgi:hypothetical protein